MKTVYRFDKNLGRVVQISGGLTSTGKTLPAQSTSDHTPPYPDWHDERRIAIQRREGKRGGTVDY